MLRQALSRSRQARGIASRLLNAGVVSAESTGLRAITTSSLVRRACGRWVYRCRSAVKHHLEVLPVIGRAKPFRFGLACTLACCMPWELNISNAIGSLIEGALSYHHRRRPARCPSRPRPMASTTTTRPWRAATASSCLAVRFFGFMGTGLVRMESDGV